ncbi:MAG: amidohydrolase family protein [Streptosporangiales bacterium]|nr:amidohydrolase family protein [Streptosporangiales bacterium]
MVPGRGAPVRDAVVVLDDGRIAYAGPAADAPRTSGEATRVATVLPGLWDCHTHLFGCRALDLTQLPMEPVAIRAARCTHDLRAALDAGVTSVREVGGLGVYLARVVAEVAGPTVYAAGAMLATTGGHADLHSLPLPWVVDYAARGGELRVCDGVDDCMRATREMLRRDAKLVKVCATGGALSEVDDPRHQQFALAELRAIVEVAALADRVVAAHCHGRAGIMVALEAGVRTIEHGTYLDDEACAAMLDAGAVLVSTRLVIEDVLSASAAPPYAVEKLEAMSDTHAKALLLAHEHGVPIALGTDIAVTGDGLPASWGRHGRELRHLVAAGLTPLQAIEAATANGPLTLGPQAPQSGQLTAGHDADVIAVDADPLADIATLGDPAHVVGVWKHGRRVK